LYANAQLHGNLSWLSYNN